MKYLLWCLPILATCQQTQTPAPPLWSGYQDGQFLFSDGASRTLTLPFDSGYAVFVLVRHCEKILDGSKDPGLTAEGQARAERLGRLLMHFQLDSVYSTNYLRTRNTAAAVIERGQLPATQLYTPEGQSELLHRLVSAGGSRRYLIVGHQNTVPMALNILTGAFNYQNLPDHAYSKCFIVVSRGIGQSTVLELDY